MRHDELMTTDAGRAWLGEKVSERRKQLRLSKEEAARRARVNVKTWTSLESGKVIRDVAYPGIEDAMQWERGSVVDALDGNDPVEIEPAEDEERDDVADLARLLDTVRRQFGNAVYSEAVKVVERNLPDSERNRRNSE